MEMAQVMLHGVDSETREIASDLYDGAIHYADSLICRIRDVLENVDILEDTVVMITSDHGEMLGEHQVLGHTYSLWEPLVRVPLNCKVPT